MAPERLAGQQTAAVESFVLALVAGARTSQLYKPGHAMIAQIAARVQQTLLAAIGQEPNLVLDVKAKQILLGEDNPLPETAETVSLAGTLHNLGVGQLLLTPQMTPQGLIELFKVLNGKPDQKVTLTDLQKAAQALRIDGLQMVFVLSFVSTGDEGEKEQRPGQLTEEQVQAFVKADNLPDFLYLLFKQNEPLIGKDAEAVTDLLDGALSRETAVERLSEAMPWSCYDARIKARFEELALPIQRWDRQPLVSRVSVLRGEDLAPLRDHAVHEKKDALTQAVALARSLLERPQSDKQPKYAVMAYARLLAELAQDSHVPQILAELGFFSRLAQRPETGPHWKTAAQGVKASLSSPSFVSSFVSQWIRQPLDAEQGLRSLALAEFVGEELVPALIEELRRLSDKDERAKLCAAMTQLCRKVGARRLSAALSDDDWLVVSSAAPILFELLGAQSAALLAPLLFHKHHRVRGMAIRLLGKAGGPAAAQGLAAFIEKAESAEEAKLAVTSLTATGQSGLDSLLIGVYQRLAQTAVKQLAFYDLRVHIVSVLGRVASSPATVDFLAKTSRRTWYEIFTGLNKSLRLAARVSLEQAKRELTVHG